MKIKTLLIAALKTEWSHLKQYYQFQKDSILPNLFHMTNLPDTALLQVGIGLMNAKANFEAFLTQHTCSNALHFGTSGALISRLKAGDIFLADQICMAADNSLIEVKHHVLTDKCRAQDIQIQSGRLLSNSEPLKNTTEKEEAAIKYKADVVDMESFAIANLCQQHNIHYTSCRCIFDTSDEDLETFGEPFDNQGDLKTSKITLNLLKNPQKILKIPALQKRMNLVNRNTVAVIKAYLS